MRIALPPASPVLTDNVRQQGMSVLRAAQSRWPRLSHLSAPPLLRQGDARHSTPKARAPQGAAALSSAAAGTQPNPALPPTATHHLHIPQGISSAACTALVITPYIFSLSSCHSVPEDEWTSAPSCWEEGGGVFAGLFAEIALAEPGAQLY